MTLPIEALHRFRPEVQVFHELMAQQGADVLLVSTPHDAWIMEEDRLSERIIHEYRGLNLSNPPRITWVPTAEAALSVMAGRKFDMVITMLNPSDAGAQGLGSEIKKRDPDLPVVHLSQQALAATTEAAGAEFPRPAGVDRTFIWSGNTDLLVALIKSAEDRLNVGHDTSSAGIRVILLVEDSPVYISSLLPLLYKEVVSQTQALWRRAERRTPAAHHACPPKILVAEDFEEAVRLSRPTNPISWAPSPTCVTHAAAGS
jgi:hypothetical protein